MNRREKYRSGYGVRMVLAAGLMLFLSSVSYGQVTYGVKINTGLGKVYSYNLGKSLEADKKNDPYLKTSDSHTSLGGNFGIGGYINYPLSAKVSLHSDPSITYQSSKLFINYMRDSLDDAYSGSRYRISSEGSIRQFYFNLPILVRYKVLDKRNYYLLSGFTLTFSSHPKLKAEEMAVSTGYNSGVIVSTNVTKRSLSAPLNNYNIFSLSFTPGVEKVCKRKLKNLSIALTANIPITKSKMFTNSSSFYDSTFNMQMLTSQGLKESEKRQFPLSDFRMTSISISLKYKLSKSSK